MKNIPNFHFQKGMQRVNAILSLAILFNLSGCFLSKEESLQTSPVLENQTKQHVDKTPDEKKLEDVIEAPAEAEDEPFIGETANYREGLLYKPLADELKTIYDALYEGLSNKEDKIKINAGNKKEIETLFPAVIADHPELFYVWPTYTYEYDKNTGMILNFMPKYADIDKIEAMQNDLEKEAVSIIEEANAYSSDLYEQELFIHDYLVENLTYFQDKQADADGIFPEYRTAYGALVNKKANCMGYSAAFSYLLNELGIDSTAVWGNAIDENGQEEAHQWNLISIDGKKYFVDVCWDDPSSTNGQDLEFIMHRYLNLDQTDMARSRTIDENLLNLKVIPEVKDRDDNYFKKNGTILFTESDFQKLLNENFYSLLNSKEWLEVRFLKPEDSKNTENDLKTILKSIDKNQKVNFQYTYSYMKTDDGWFAIKLER